MTFYKAWIETKSSSEALWQQHESLVEEEDGQPGMYFTDAGMCSGVDDLAQQILARFLTSVLRYYPDQPDLQVRAHAQIDEPPHAGPSSIRQACSADMAEARAALRLEALDRGLRDACHQVSTARRDLERAVVTAHDQGLSLHAVTTATSYHLSADEVTRLIDAPVLFGEVRALVRSRPELAARVAVRDAGLLGVKVKLLWTYADHDAEELRERGWSESIDDYDPELAATLLASARNDATELLTLLSSQFQVLSRGNKPPTPGSMAPRALVYQSVAVRRTGRQTGLEGSAA